MVTAERCTGAIGVALVFTQIQVDAAVEGAGEVKVHQTCFVKVTGGVIDNRMLANTQARLCRTLLVHQVNTSLGDFRKVIDRLSLYGTGRQRRQSPKGSHRLLLGQTGTDQDTAEVLGNIGSVVGLHVVKGQRLNSGRQPTFGIGQGMGRAVHDGVDGPSRQTGGGFALLHQSFNSLGLQTLEVLGQECRLEDALHHQVHTLVQMLRQDIERHG